MRIRERKLVSTQTHPHPALNSLRISRENVVRVEFISKRLLLWLNSGLATLLCVVRSMKFFSVIFLAWLSIMLMECTLEIPAKFPNWAKSSITHWVRLASATQQMFHGPVQEVGRGVGGSRFARTLLFRGAENSAPSTICLRLRFLAHTPGVTEGDQIFQLTNAKPRQKQSSQLSRV